ncbi:GNAT family N-acetyltransferase [Microbacterium terricola]|uniref:GNAT family acetyltransferase n=1 Tax=Microbacterium terricola TaxID=344163 RepID=A0ABM8DXH2_9MICO|nr:GNAT family N-acetyltransferase [Microbacterium terricola]UYK38973.1 GNAT family N-acetyltransferase [Microbacterium terricola]BDV30324.1 GNAT family acetyltransferase [Microbacterium terricola]
MPTITIEPATASRFDDAEHALTGGGDGPSCQCQWWMLSSTEFNRTTKPERLELLRAQTGDDLPPGLIAYVDGQAAGWVKVAPRTAQPRLARTRAYAGSPEPWDDPDVWAVSCFVVRREHRGAGLNAALLDAAIDFARAHGARSIEAYPIDTRMGTKVSSNELFHGALSTFVGAGFREVARPKPHVVIVSLTLA